MPALPLPVERNDRLMEQAASLRLATRMASLEPSATLAMAARAGAMKAEGIDVIDLSVGEPDFATPPHICEAGAAAIAAGKTKYTPAAGIPALREAVAADVCYGPGVDTVRRLIGVEYEMRLEQHLRDLDVNRLKDSDAC